MNYELANQTLVTPVTNIFSSATLPQTPELTLQAPAVITAASSTWTEFSFLPTLPSAVNFSPFDNRLVDWASATCNSTTQWVQGTASAWAPDMSQVTNMGRHAFDMASEYKEEAAITAAVAAVVAGVGLFAYKKYTGRHAQQANRDVAEPRAAEPMKDVLLSLAKEQKADSALDTALASCPKDLQATLRALTFEALKAAEGDEKNLLSHSQYNEDQFHELKLKFIQSFASQDKNIVIRDFAHGTDKQQIEEEIKKRMEEFAAQDLQATTTHRSSPSK